MVLLAAFSTNLTLTILTIALAPIALDLHVSIGDVAWVTLAPMVVSAVVTPTWGIPRAKILAAHGRSTARARPCPRRSADFSPQPGLTAAGDVVFRW